MAYTANDLEALERAIKRGVLSVRQGDRTVTYNSIKDLIAARDKIKAEVEAAAGTGRKRVIRFHQSGTGY